MNEKLNSINKLLAKAGKKNLTIDDLRTQIRSPVSSKKSKLISIVDPQHLPSIRPKSSIRPGDNSQIAKKSVVPSK
jgi:hypothetical protein